MAKDLKKSLQLLKAKIYSFQTGKLLAERKSKASTPPAGDLAVAGKEQWPRSFSHGGLHYHLSREHDHIVGDKKDFDHTNFEELHRDFLNSKSHLSRGALDHIRHHVSYAAEVKDVAGPDDEDVERWANGYLDRLQTRLKHSLRHAKAAERARKQKTPKHYQKDDKTSFRGDKGKFKKGELSDYRAGADPMLKPGQSYEQLREAEAMKKSSKNKKEKREQAFGGWHTAPDSKQRAKQMGALEELGRKRYGMETERAPGKPTAKGPVIDKPHLMTGKFQHIGNPDSLVHEMGHVERAPAGQSLADYQVDMDREWGVQNVKHGFKQQARAKEEYETTALEQPLRRRAGLPPHLKETSNPDPKRDYAVDEPGRKITKEITMPSGRKAKLTGTSANRSPEANTRVSQVDRGELRYDPLRGWHPGQGVDAKINRRAREKAKEPGRKDAKTLLRSEQQPGQSLNDLKKPE